MDEPVVSIELETTADLTDEHTKIYQNVRVVYHFYGKNLEESKLEKAVNLSVEKYCGVMEMFRKFATIAVEIQFHHT